jgi:cytochrome c-type biogenesis protein CcmH
VIPGPPDGEGPAPPGIPAARGRGGLGRRSPAGRNAARRPSPLRAAALALALLSAAPALSAVGRPEDRLPDPALESRAQEIGRELRCMVCQNQSIEDSDADLARDLRRIVRERVSAGDDSAAVMRFVHDRYGDFVLLRPPFNPVTALLWAMPVIALGGGIAVIVARRRRYAAQGIEPVPLSEAERRRLAELERSTGA